MDKALQLVKTGEFEGVRFDCYQDSGKEFWGTREQIGAMLGYSDPRKAIANIHGRNKARLDKFSSTLNLRTEAGMRETTVYNFKGLLEICRYSDMPKANAVMDFLWDIADEIRRTGRYGVNLDELCRPFSRDVQLPPRQRLEITERVRVMQRMIEEPAYKLSPEERRVIVRRLINMTM